MNPSTLRLGKRVVATAAAAYATYTAWNCPCEDYLSCHKGQYIGALAAAAFMAFL